jgi:hypothetical protein
LVFIHIEHICSFFSATIDGRNLIFGHKLHIGMPYCGKRFWTRQIPTSPSTVTEKNAAKNILDGRKDDRGKTVYPSPPLGSGGIKKEDKI